MYLILCWSYLNHSLRFVGEKRGYKKKSHNKSQSQYFGKKSQLDYFPKSFSPSLAGYFHKGFRMHTYDVTSSYSSSSSSSSSSASPGASTLASSFADTDHLRKMSKSVPLFLGEDVRSTDPQLF